MTNKNSNSNPTNEKSGTFTSLVEQARQGRREVLPRLRKLLDEIPELWQSYGDLAKHVQCSWLKLIGGQDHYLRETLKHHGAALKQSLAGPDASPLELLQIERILALNLQLGYYECQLARFEGQSRPTLVKYIHEACAGIDRRLQQAMVNLLRMRKLVPEAMRVEVVVSGTVETVAREATETSEEPASQPETHKIHLPHNRVRELLREAN